jgi:hypothetical protein
MEQIRCDFATLPGHFLCSRYEVAGVCAGTGSKLRTDRAVLGFEHEAECDNDVTGTEGVNGWLWRYCSYFGAKLVGET